MQKRHFSDMVCCLAVVFVCWDLRFFFSPLFYRQLVNTDSRAETTPWRTETSSFSNSTHQTRPRKSDPQSERPPFLSLAQRALSRRSPVAPPCQSSGSTLTALLFKIRIGPPLQIVAAFEGAYYSPDTSLISITGASADTADSGDNATCSSPPPADNACFTVAQMSTLNKTFDKTRLCVFWDVCIEWGKLHGDGDSGPADRWLEN